MIYDTYKGEIVITHPKKKKMHVGKMHDSAGDSYFHCRRINVICSPTHLFCSTLKWHEIVYDSENILTEHDLRLYLII